MSDLAGSRVTHIEARATTMAWTKENLLILGGLNLPEEAEKITTLDAEVTFRHGGRAREIPSKLDLYPVVQPWDTACDLGPRDVHIETHKSLAAIFHSGAPLTPSGDTF